MSVRYQIDWFNPVRKRYQYYGDWNSLEQAKKVMKKPYMVNNTVRLIKVTTEVVSVHKVKHRKKKNKDNE